MSEGSPRVLIKNARDGDAARIARRQRVGRSGAERVVVHGAVDDAVDDGIRLQHAMSIAWTKKELDRLSQRPAVQVGIVRIRIEIDLAVEILYFQIRQQVRVG